MPTFLPSLDGQISSCFADLPVQPLLQKYFPSRLTQITSKSLTVSFRSEGRSRVVTSAGRDAVDAAASGDVRGWQGGSIKARELTNGTQTNDACCGLRSRVVLAPVAGVKFAEASRPNRADKTLIRGRRWQDEFVAGESAV